MCVGGGGGGADSYRSVRAALLWGHPMTLYDFLAPDCSLAASLITAPCTGANWICSVGLLS